MRDETRLWELCSQITPADKQAMEACKHHWDAIAKPLGGLGLLEEAVTHMAGCLGHAPSEHPRKAVAVFCADNGVVAQGVTQTGQDVTASVARTMAQGNSCVCRMAHQIGAAVIPIDMGMAQEVDVPGLRQWAVRRGTADLSIGPAMERREAVEAIWKGISLASELAAGDIQLAAAGEMGIGNTTTAAAISAVLLNLPPEQVVGRGAGLSDVGLGRKLQAIQDGLKINCPNPQDPIDIICKVGGLDIAGMTGFYLGCARYALPVLLDGAISCAAALAAVRMCPAAQKAMLASHCSAEPMGERLLRKLELRPLIFAELHLGEGTGAVAAMPMLDMALEVYHHMTTFDGMGIEAYVPQNG